MPGNHDVQRSNTANYVSKMLDGINSEKEVAEILGSKELREIFLKRLNNYYDFVKKLHFRLKNQSCLIPRILMLTELRLRWLD